MAKKTGQIVIDGTDWLENVLQRELVVTSKDEMLDVAIKHGPKMAAIAAIVSRLIGEAPEDILEPNKELLSNGGAGQIYIWIRNMKTRLETEAGNRITVSSYNKPPIGDDDEDDDTNNGNGKDPVDRRYAEAGTPRYYDNAVNYLERVVPGHIRNRLAEIAVSGGDPRQAADWLIDKIEEIVASILEDNGHE